MALLFLEVVPKPRSGEEMGTSPDFLYFGNRATSPLY